MVFVAQLAARRRHIARKHSAHVPRRGLARAVEFDPAVLCLGEHDDQAGSGAHLLAIEAGELRLFRKANEFADWAAVLVKKGVNAFGLYCWKVGHRLGFLALGWDTPLVFARGR